MFDLAGNPQNGRPPGSSVFDSLRPTGMVQVIAWTIAVAAIPPLLHNVYRGSWATAVVLVVAEAGVLASLVLDRRGHGRAAVGVLFTSVQACAGGLVAAGQGFHDVALLLFPATLVVSGLLLGRLAFAGVTVGTIAFLVALGVAEMHGWFVTPLSRFTLARNLVDTAVILAATAVVVSLLAQSVRTSLASARRHEASLEAVNAELVSQSQRLRVSEERFRSLIDLAVDGILVGDVEGRLIGVNRRMAELTGFSSEELLGRSICDLFTREEMRRAPLRYDRVAAGETVVTERVLLRKDGGAAPVEMSSKQMPDGSYHSFFRDTTERRRAAEERARLRDELRHAQKMEAVGRLAGGIAHDFNNMLMVIGSSVAVARRDLVPGSRAHRCLADVEAATEKAAALTRQLLAFGRKESVAPRVIDLGDLLTNLAPMVAGIVGPDVELNVRAPRGLGLARVEAGLLEQAVLNLAVNARDAMPGGGDLELGLSEVELDQAGALALGLAPGTCLALSVADKGTGMTDEVRQHLFEPFFTTKPSGKGTGLGLAMVYGAVKQSGGGIEVETRLGRGTTFRLFFPRAAGALEETRPPVAARETAAVDIA
jgi:PAS domain S-box-containing protein